jgi:hypothetical protein
LTEARIEEGGKEKKFTNKVVLAFRSRSLLQLRFKVGLLRVESNLNRKKTLLLFSEVKNNFSGKKPLLLFSEVKNNFSGKRNSAVVLRGEN